MTRSLALTIGRLAVALTAGLLVCGPALRRIEPVRPPAAAACAGQAAESDPACRALWRAARERFLGPHSEGEP